MICSRVLYVLLVSYGAKDVNECAEGDRERERGQRGEWSETPEPHSLDRMARMGAVQSTPSSRSITGDEIRDTLG